MWLSRIGILLDMLGAIILAADIVGQQRLRSLDKQVAISIKSIRKPLSFYHRDRSVNGVSGIFATVGILISISSGLALLVIYYDFLEQYWGSFGLWILGSMILVPILGFIFSLMVTVCISIMLYISLIPIKGLYTFQEKLKLPETIRLFGVAFLLVGFILQFFGTF